MLLLKKVARLLVGLAILIPAACWASLPSHGAKGADGLASPSEASGISVEKQSKTSVKQALSRFLESPQLHSQVALVIHDTTGNIVLQKNKDQTVPIASITKMMTAMVILDAYLPMNDMITISADDIDMLKGSRSRLAVGTTLPRRELLLLAIMSSENRAAAALARTYPGGTVAFIEQMNKKAQALKMNHTVFSDSTGLSPNNLSTATDLALMTKAAYRYPLIRDNSTKQLHQIVCSDGTELTYHNSNPIVREGLWDIRLQKTGFTREAGRCMVAYAKIDEEPYVFVLLAARNNALRVQDARLLKTWLEQSQHLY